MRRSHPPCGTTTLTAKGQLTIPIGVRQALGIQPGDAIAITVRGDVLHFTVQAPVRPRRRRR